MDVRQLGPIFAAASGRLTAEDGRAARERRPRSTLAQLADDPDRDPVAIASANDAERVADLLPERYLRMSASCFTFYRGSASIMAHDLGAVPNSGITTQLCGDAHIANFGAFASPERELVFDVNDFDETAPGPFEWDVLRLATSVILAAEELGVDNAQQQKIARGAAKGYQEEILALAARSELDVWYEQVSVRQLLEIGGTDVRRRTSALVAKAETRDAASAVRKLTEVVDGELQFRSDPPVLVRMGDLDRDLVTSTLASYRETLPPDRRLLLDRYHLVDVAFKAVGVGSVGTRCLIGLLLGNEHGEPLILQLKEAGTSVLEPFTVPAALEHHGRRVVEGQRLMQASSDIFLGWTTGADDHHFYWRQLRDMKFSPNLAAMRPEGLRLYARLCGQVLARAHARGGNRAAIAGYVGKGGTFRDAVTQFAAAYALRAEADYAQLLAARIDGRLPG